MTFSDHHAVGSADGDDNRAPRQVNPWRKPHSPEAERLIDDIIQMIEDRESEEGLRKRARKANDFQTFHCAITAVVSDLAINALAEDSKGFRLYRSNGKLKYGSRYRSPLTTKALPSLLDLLRSPALKLAEQDLGEGKANGQGIQTHVWPSSELLSMLEIRGLSAEDFTEVEPVEPIELKGEKQFRDRPAPRIEYEDNEQSIRFRNEIREINRHLVHADLAYTGEAPVDLNKRHLRRIFTRCSFQSGGRLYGGFWQPMNKDDRLRHLRINGEKIVELDYGQIMPRLVYSLAGVCPEQEDLYDIPGLEQLDRSGIKRVMSSMLFVEKRLTRFPRGTRCLFPPNISISDVIEAIEAAHPAIAPYFFTGIGHRCQFLESEIMVDLLRRLRACPSIEGVALPIHDAILVPASEQRTATNFMSYAFWRRTRLEAVVDVLSPNDLEEEDLLKAA